MSSLCLKKPIFYRSIRDSSWVTVEQSLFTDPYGSDRKLDPNTYLVEAMGIWRYYIEEQSRIKNKSIILKRIVERNGVKVVEELRTIKM